MILHSCAKYVVRTLTSVFWQCTDSLLLCHTNTPDAYEGVIHINHTFLKLSCMKEIGIGGLFRDIQKNENRDPSFRLYSIQNA